MTKILYIIRHAEPTIRNGRKGGLSNHGKLQAARLSKKLLVKLQGSQAVVFCSRVARSQQTACIIAGELHCSLRQADLRFKGVEQLSGVSDIGSKYHYYKRQYKALQIESPEAYTKRVCELVLNTPTNVVMLVGHEVSNRVLLEQLGAMNAKPNVTHAACFRVILNVNKGEIFTESI
jgi:broad specificity phosphatase PhoE